MWRYDVNTYEEVNVLEHIKVGKATFDANWNVISEITINALLYKGGKKGGKKGRMKGDNFEIVWFKYCRKGQYPSVLK